MLISPAYAQTAGAEGALIMQILPIVLIFAVFYFLLIRPQQKKMKQHREMVAALRRGDRVVTAGGIIATVAKVLNENELLVEIAEGVRVRLVRSQVTDVIGKGAPASGTPEEAAAPASDDSKKTGGGLFGKSKSG